MIHFKNVSKIYDDGFYALRNISFDVKNGEIFGILGESGAGKSTLLKTINALEDINDGEIVVLDQSVHTLEAKYLRNIRKDISIIFQDYNLLQNKTVQENIELALDLQRKQCDSQKITQSLAYVGLDSKVNQYPSKLSGGEKQRVAIARALITKPKILLCDEPTSALDQNHRFEIVQLLKQVNRDFGTTIIIVTHDIKVAKALCHRVAILEKGELVSTVNVSNTNLKKHKSYKHLAKEVLES